MLTGQTIRYSSRFDDLKHATEGSAGIDLRAAESVVIPVSAKKVVSTDTVVEIPPGHVGLVFVRSSLGFKHGICLANSVGVIDSDYRGDIGLALMNHGQSPFEIQEGDRIAQLIVMPYVRALMTRVPLSDLTVTERADGGFGSTGVK